MPVDNDEVLYRQVPNRSSHFSYSEGQLHLSSSAFNDASSQPSVDRARLNGNDPNRTKKAPTDGVASLVTEQVRAITDVVQRERDGTVEFTYRIDVEAAPIDGNEAHALIVTDPAFRSGNTFKRLKESLARLASARGWAVEPS